MGGDYCTGEDDQMGGDDRSYSRNGTILAICAEESSYEYFVSDL